MMLQLGSRVAPVARAVHSGARRWLVLPTARQARQAPILGPITPVGSACRGVTVARWLISTAGRAASGNAAAAAGSSSTAAGVKQTLVFSCNKDGFIRLMRGAALAQCTFLIGLATIAPDIDWGGDPIPAAKEGQPRPPPPKREQSAWGWGVAAGSLLIAAAFGGATASITRRMVHSITLVDAPGKERLVNVTTYALFGKRTLPLKPSDLRFNTGGKFAFELEGKQTLFDIAGHRGKFQLDREGKFVSARAFNSLLKQAG